MCLEWSQRPYCACVVFGSNPNHLSTRTHWATIQTQRSLGTHTKRKTVSKKKKKKKKKKQRVVTLSLKIGRSREPKRQQQISNGVTASGSFTNNSTISHFLFSISNSGHTPQPQPLAYTSFYSLSFNSLRVLRPRRQENRQRKALQSLLRQREAA